MKLSELCRSFVYRADKPCEDLTVGALCSDSRGAQAGDCFFCLRGARYDGHRFAADAYARGVRIFFCEQALSLPDDAICLLVDNCHRAYALACGAFFGAPYPFVLIGVTGTKGKTTVATYLYHILRESGKRVGMIGTSGICFGQTHIPSANTTPEAYTLHKALSDFAAQGAQYVILEVSSQAYLCHRVDGLVFDVGIFTNLSCDHTGKGEHADFADYRRCKQRLFQNSLRAVLNQDDAHFADFAAACTGEYQTYSLCAEADCRAESIVPFCGADFFGAQFLCHSLQGTLRVRLSLPGEHNVANALAAICAAQSLGMEAEAICRALLRPVTGRYERIRLSCGADAVIDYAHNEASLAAALRALSPFVSGKLYCLFGAVGGRTQGRRAGMGRVAAALCDYCILTSDNPDLESPVQICAEIAAVFPPSFPYTVLCDRTEAIRFALGRLQAGDLLLLCGKGHERTQRIGGKDLPFCEREILLAWEQERISQKNAQRACKITKKKVQ